MPITAYVEPTCFGLALPDMPLFLTPEHYSLNARSSLRPL